MCLLHTRIQEFSPRGEGGEGSRQKKAPLPGKKTLASYFFCFSPNCQLLNSFTEGGGVRFFLFDLILFAPSTIFQLYRGRSSWIEPVLSYDKCVLLKDHNAVMPVKLEAAAHMSRAKHSTTEPLCSQSVQLIPGVGMHRNLSKLGFSMQGGQTLYPPSGSTRVRPSLASSLVPVIDLHILFVYELGRTGRSFLKPHWCHSAVSLSKTHLSFNQGRPVPTLLKDCWLGRKESNQTNNIHRGNFYVKEIIRNTVYKEFYLFWRNYYIPIIQCALWRQKT